LIPTGCHGPAFGSPVDRRSHIPTASAPNGYAFSSPWYDLFQRLNPTFTLPRFRDLFLRVSLLRPVLFFSLLQVPPTISCRFRGPWPTLVPFFMPSSRRESGLAHSKRTRLRWTYSFFFFRRGSSTVRHSSLCFCGLLSTFSNLSTEFPIQPSFFRLGGKNRPF